MPEIVLPNQKTVLLVEDDVFLSNLLSVRLQKLGALVLRAYDGEEALGVVKTSGHKIDLILLDIIIPKKSGFEVLEELKADPVFKEIPVMIVSNLGQDADVEHAKRLGSIFYFIKAQVPIDDIISKIKSFLETGQV